MPLNKWGCQGGCYECMCTNGTVWIHYQRRRKTKLAVKLDFCQKICYHGKDKAPLVMSLTAMKTVTKGGKAKGMLSV